MAPRYAPSSSGSMERSSIPSSSAMTADATDPLRSTGGPFLAADLVERDGRGRGHVERANAPHQGDVGDGVAAPEAGGGQAMVLVTESEAHGAGQVDLVQRLCPFGQLD